MAPAATTLTPAVRSWLVELFERTVDGAYNVAYRLLWNHADAADVVQNVFIKAVLHRDQLIDAGKARSWVLGISYREALMVLRGRRDTPTDPSRLPDRPAPASDPEELALRSELATLLGEAIDALPDSLRVAFVLRDVEELPMAEVASVLDIGESAAKMRVARGRESLRITLTGRI